MTYAPARAADDSVEALVPLTRIDRIAPTANDPQCNAESVQSSRSSHDGEAVDMGQEYSRIMEGPSTAQPVRLVVVGGIGAGKSTVLARLEALGALVIENRE